MVSQAVRDITRGSSVSITALPVIWAAAVRGSGEHSDICPYCAGSEPAPAILTAAARLA